MLEERMELLVEAFQASGRRSSFDILSDELLSRKPYFNTTWLCLAAPRLAILPELPGKISSPVLVV
jgi:hypothetical protein